MMTFGGSHSGVVGVEKYHLSNAEPTSLFVPSDPVVAATDDPPLPLACAAKKICAMELVFTSLFAEVPPPPESSREVSDGRDSSFTSTTAAAAVG